MNHIAVGEIINTHGISGEVKVLPLTHDVERFSELARVYIGKDKKKANISNVKYHKGLVIIEFEEFDNINLVLPFKGQYLYIDEADRIKLPEDHFFIYEIIDCQVVDLSGNKIGYIKDVLEYASNDVYVVSDYSKEKEYLIPAVKEFIKEVNILEKLVVIDPIEGMIE
ncbi:MAG TPA: ribosome maturation factor RimM [Tissierellaceae bacterium]|nr:ribosome maturation factor RimM [Tissierellaceae bacterium]